MSLQQLHSDAAELRAQLSNKNSSLDREAFDRAALLSQIEALNSQLVSASQTQEGIEADNRRLMQELYSERTQNSMLTERVAALLKRAASASDATKVMSSRLAAVERERDAMRSLAAMERQKASELGSVVEISRAQAATASAQLNRYMIEYGYIYGYISYPKLLYVRFFNVAIHIPIEVYAHMF